jgi:hypothetical protein
MKKIKLAFSVFSMLFSSLVAAHTLIPLPIHLGGVRVNHSLQHPAKGAIPLSPLFDFSPEGVWHISCDFNIIQKDGDAIPSNRNPFPALIDLKTYGDVSPGWDYSSVGFLAPSGKFEIFLPGSETGLNEIDFINFDTSGDLIISNCVATLKLGAVSQTTTPS